MKRETVWCGLAGLAILLLVPICISDTRHQTWDEFHHVRNLKYVQEFGLTKEFLRSIDVATGPVYHALCYLLGFGKGAVAAYQMRWLSFACLLGLLATCIAMLRIFAPNIAWISAFQILGIPLVSVLGGIGMTDMLSLFLFHAHLVLLALAVTQPKHKIIFASFAGMFLGLAITTRQVFLIVLLTLPVFLFDRRLRAIALPYLLLSLPLPLWLFSVWGGLTAPKESYPSQFISLFCLLVGLSHAAIQYLIYEPEYYFRKPSRMLRSIALGIVTVCGLAALGVADLGQSVPFWGIVKREVPNWLFLVYCYGFSGVALGFVFPFVRKLVSFFVDAQTGFQKICAAMTILLLSSPAKITHNYSSRYILVGLPLLVMLQLVASPNDTKFKALRIFLGGCFGLFILLYYGGRLT